LVLTNHKCIATDYSNAPWNNASLVTPHHAVHRVWNDTELQKHGKEAGCFVLEGHAEDMIKGQPLTLAECYAALLHVQGADFKQCKQNLPNIMLGVVKFSSEPRFEPEPTEPNL